MDAALFRYDPGTGDLAADLASIHPRSGTMIAAMLHRRVDARTGPVIATLIRVGGIPGQTRVYLDRRDRAALSTGGLYLQLYTTVSPLGEEPLTLTVAGDPAR